MTEENTQATPPTEIDRSKLPRLLEIEKQIEALEKEQKDTAESLGVSLLFAPIEKVEAFVKEIFESEFAEGKFVNDITFRIYELRLQAETVSQAEAVSSAMSEDSLQDA